MASGQAKSRAFARRCGIKGGAKKLSAEERSETAKKAAAIRWAKSRLACSDHPTKITFTQMAGWGASWA